MGSSDKYKESRRRFLSQVLTAGLSLPSQWAKAKVVPEAARRKVAVSPPGSRSHARLNSMCTGCGLCISKCPSKILQPSTTEYDGAGVMQPFLDFSRNGCPLDCSVCGESCPTGAIEPLNAEQREDVQIGLAIVVKGLCRNATGEPCNACAEACPVGAISMKEDYNAPLENGFRRYPTVEPLLCVGCGACEAACPSEPAKAIHVEGFEVHSGIEESLSMTSSTSSATRGL